MLERITITIDKNLLKSVDANIDGKSVRNRSQAISYLVEKAMGKTFKAIVLCGKPETALKKIGDQPVLYRLIEYLKRNGITEVIIALSENSQKVIDCVNKINGVKIEFVWDDGKGTALALEKAKNFLNDTFLLSYADVLYEDLNLNDFLEFHKKNSGLTTIALAEVKKTALFGTAKMMGSKIIEFEEKPSESETNLVNAGVAFCEPQVLSFINQKTLSFEKDLLPLLAKQGKLMGYNYSGEWKHYG
ncbi:hypothetical protein HUU53_00495 [Candidatus Micrarchaeota archaeon]|nr:hypothetical protein [Candidatus Micrarchaeota archaeon]